MKSIIWLRLNLSENLLRKPSSTPPREVVDASYDCDLTVVFDDLNGHDAYQDDPIHHLFIKNCAHLWEKVRIYDAE